MHAESDTVAQFRAAINDKFGRFDAFYDACNNAMTNYRIIHVEEMISVINPLLKIFGYDIEYVRESRAYVNQVVSDVLQLLGGKIKLFKFKKKIKKLHFFY